MNTPQLRLTVDVGNTEIVVGVVRRVADGLEVSAHWRMSTPVVRTADEFEQAFSFFLAREGIEPAGSAAPVLGSVVPGVTSQIRRALERLSGGAAHVVDGVTELGIRLDVEEPRTVGADRIVNTLAAKELFARDTVVVDFGTATTFDCISHDGVFLGGVIAPGILAGLKWLGEGTAKLPSVGFRRPDSVIGRRTETCMESGVFFTAVDSIDGIVARILEEWDRPDALVVATGGLAEPVGRHLRTVTVHEPFLTLLGLALAGERLDAAG